MSLISPESNQDFIFEHLAHSPGAPNRALPLMLLLETEQPVRDQGNRGTCAAHVGAEIIGFTRKHRRPMSAEFIYHHRSNAPASGMHGRDVFNILKKLGDVPESEFPYNNNNMPTANNYQEAQLNRIESYSRVRTLEGLKSALYNVGPCYMLLLAYTGEPEFWRDPSTFDEGNENIITPIAHAVTVIGYNMNSFILKNSWSNTWNQNGHVNFPFSDFGLVLEIWASN